MKKWMWFVITVLVVVSDQFSKYEIRLALEPYQPYSIMPMLQFTLAYNTGAAFSFLSGTGHWHHWFFTAFSSFVSIALVGWIIRLPSHDRILLLALSLILGGAVGNLMDRILLGHVIDFIDVFYKTHHWPVFNIADTAITFGTVLLMVDGFIRFEK